MFNATTQRFMPQGKLNHGLCIYYTACFTPEITKPDAGATSQSPYPGLNLMCLRVKGIHNTVIALKDTDAELRIAGTCSYEKDTFSNVVLNQRFSS